jgi:hypothetical protein
MLTLPGSRSRRGGQPGRGPRRPRGFQADDPVVAVGFEPRRDPALPLPTGALFLLKPRRRGGLLAPAIHGAAHGAGHLHPVPGVGRVEQPGLDQGVEMVFVQPEGDQPLAALVGNDPAAQRLSQRQGSWSGCAASIQGGLGGLAAQQRDVQPLHLAAQRRELQTRPRHEVLGERSRCRRVTVALRTQRTGILRQGCLLLQNRADVRAPRRLRIRITNGPGSSDRIINLGWAALVKPLRRP